MAKVTLNNLANLTNQQTAVSTINTNNDRIEAAMEKTLSRDGTTPNQMEDLLDMNSNRIINLPEPSTFTEPVRYGEFESLQNAVDALVDSQQPAITSEVHTVASAILSNFDNTITFINTQGFYSVGDGGRGLYRKTLIQPVHYGWFTSADGKMWELVSSSEDSAQFGSRGDNTNDDTIPIQSSIDSYAYATDWGLKPANDAGVIGFGKFKTTQPLHVGWGDGFRKVCVKGKGSSYQGGSVGTTISPTFSNAPVFAVQGGRRSAIKEIGIVGQNFNHLLNNGFGSIGPTGDDRDAANWWSPSLDANGNSRFAPYAGVAVDPYAGNVPTPAYPTYTVPSYITLSSQYLRPVSSVVELNDLDIVGCAVGIVVHPSGSDGNGDFVKTVRSRVSYCVYGISIAQTQARLMSMSGVDVAVVHTAYTSTTHGRRQGRLTEIIDSQASNCINVFELASTAVNGPVCFRGCYGELVWRLGLINSDNSNKSSVMFDNCHWDFGAQNVANQQTAMGIARKGVPPYLIRQVGDNAIIFTGGALTSYHRVFVINGGGVGGFSMDGTRMFYSSTAVDLYEKLALHASCGGLILHNFGSSNNFLKTRPTVEPKFLAYNLGTGNGEQIQLKETWLGNRNLTTPIYAKYHSGNNSASQVSKKGDTPPLVDFCSLVASSPSSSSATATLTDRTLTLTFSGRAEWQFIKGFNKGDILYHQATGSTFFVSDRTGQVVTAELQNNFEQTNTGWVPIEPITLTSGIMYCANTRLFTLGSLYFGDFTSGSPTITNVKAWNGISAIEGEIQVGDMLVSGYDEGIFTSPATGIVTNRSNSGSTITLNGNASLTMTHVPLWNWFRTI